MNGTSGFQEVRSSPPDHHCLASCTSNGLSSEQVPGTFFGSILFAVGAWVLLSIASIAIAQTEPITPSGLNTQINLSATPPPSGVQYDITGGTRPGGGTNLFHSFGEFGVPTNNIANFLNETALPTSNILGRVTGGNPSILFGTIQTTGFGNANLFLMNPTGFLFGPNATVNVGGMVHFTTADYLRLSDGVRFEALPGAQDALLSTVPVAAFGFLGTDPAAIAVQGSQLTVANGTGLSLVGGDISIGADPAAGTPAYISAPSGHIDLVSVASPGEILYPSLQRASNINGQSFTAMGNIAILDFASVDVSGSLDQGDGHGGAIRIRGGKFIIENFSFLTASTQGDVAGDTPNVSVLVDGAVALHNVSGIVTGTGSGEGRDGGVEIVATNVEIADGSFILTGSLGPAAAGNITIQADTISLTGGFPDEGLFTNISTIGSGSVEGGTISLSGRASSGQTLSISDQGQILTSSISGRGGDIRIEMDNVTVSGGASLIATSADSASAGDIIITAKESFSLTGLSPGGTSAISTNSSQSPANISITTGQFLLGEGARIDGQTSATQGGQIGISATGSITIQDNSFITSISNVGTGASLEFSAPTILIDQSTLSARSAGTADGGMITAHATNGNLILDHGSVIASSTGGSGAGGPVEVTAADSVLIAGGSRIESNSFSTSSGDAGSVTVRAQSVLVDVSGSGLFTETQGSGAGGNIFVDANTVTLQNGGTLSAKTSGTAPTATGGTITVNTTDHLTMTGGASITASSTGPGDAGNVAISGDSLTVASGGRIEASTSGAGNGGSIAITTTGDITVTGLSADGQVRSGIFAKTLSAGGGSGSGSGGGGSGSGGGSGGGGMAPKSGSAGDITITANNLLLDGGAQIDSSTTSGGAGGTVSITTAENITIAGSSTRLTSDATRGNGKGGNITLVAKNITVRDNASVTAATGGKGDAGNVTLTALDQLLLQSAGTITTSTSGSGKGGTITIQASQVLLDGQGTGITADTLRPFADMTITINILHLNDGDLVVQLDSPTGTRVALLSRVGGTGDNFTNTGFNDQATTQITSGSAPFTGTFTPREPLGQLNNELVAGNWTLNVRDQATGNVGTLQNWTLQIGSQTFQSTVGSRVIPDNGNVRSTITVANPTVPTVQAVGEPAGIGGNVTINADMVTVQNGATLSATTRGSGQGGTVNVNATGQVALTGLGSGIFTDSEASGAGGSIFVNADLVTLQNGGTLSAKTSGTEVTAIGGNITVHADQIALQSGAVITSSTSGAGDGGTVSLYANESISLVNSSIASNSETPPGTPIVGNGGQLNLSAPSITLEQGSALLALTTGSGRAGAIELNTNNLSLADMSVAQTSTQGPGPAGSITVQGLGGSGTKVQALSLAGGSSLSSSSVGNDEGEGGAAGNILVETQTLSLSGGSQITTSSIFSPGDAGTIRINAGEEVQLSQGILTSRSESNIPDEFVNDYVIGNAGSIIVSAPSVTLKNHSLIASTTDSRYTGDPSKGNAGSVTVNATNLSLTEGSQLTSSSIIGDSGQSPVGNAGTVTAQGFMSPASSVLIDGAGSGIFTDTQGTGAGGNIFVNANSVTLQSGGTLSAATSGMSSAATGGTIMVEGNQVQLTNGGLITASTTGAGAGGSINIGTGTFASNASTVSSTASQAQGGDIKITSGQSVTLNNDSLISARSTGAGNAGNILINAGQNYTSTNSAVTTQATAPDTEASGGNITVLATDMVQLTNSQLNASVQGSSTTVGGNITIDPQYVILQNSQILAQATQGQGGAISITIANGGLFLSDANSTVSASSKFGVNGTVTIQSPNAPGSGQIQPLGKSPLLATSLLNQRCAALAGGEFSSFTVAGRDSLPTEPGGWLASPLATLNAGMGLGVKAEGVRPVVRDEEPEGETALLSLRKIVPVGFLTQAFAVDWSAGCGS